WFLHVKASYQQQPGGRIVILTVAERPTLRYVQYMGNENIKDKKLAKETGLKVGDAVDPYAIEEARRKIEQFYHDHGYNKATVKILEGTNHRDKGAVFVI